MSERTEGPGWVAAGQQLAMVAVSLATVAVGVVMLPALPPGGGLVVAAYAGLVAMALAWHWLASGDDEPEDVESVGAGPEESASNRKPAAD